MCEVEPRLQVAVPAHQGIQPGLASSAAPQERAGVEFHRPGCCNLDSRPNEEQTESCTWWYILDRLDKGQISTFISSSPSFQRLLERSLERTLEAAIYQRLRADAPKAETRQVDLDHDKMHERYFRPRIQSP